MKREVIISKLKRIVSTIETNHELPLIAKELFVFGSTLWKDNPEDLDLILIHDKLSKEASQSMISALMGSGTLPTQKMNRRLKRSNAERIKILYGYSLKDVLSISPIGYYRLYWDRNRPEWRGNLNLDIDDLKEVILKLREIIDKLDQTRSKYQLVLDEIIDKNLVERHVLSEIENYAERKVDEGSKMKKFRF